MPDVTILDTPVQVTVDIVDDIATVAVVVNDPDLPSGGLAGDVLVKLSSASYHVGWGSGTRTSHFDTVADMLASYDTFALAECANYLPADKNFSLWARTLSPYLLPNNTDIRQTLGGLVLIRTFVRESLDDIVLPDASFASYEVSVPVVAPTVADLRAGFYSARLVFVVDPATPYMYRRGNDNALDDTTNGVINAVGLHYDRHTVV